jgi:hypothetical protein
MLVPSICGLDKLGFRIMVTDGAFVAAMAKQDSKLNPSKVRRAKRNTLDTTYLRAHLVMGRHNGALFLPMMVLLGTAGVILS